MNIDTGELVYLDQIPEELRDQFVRVPDELAEEAEKLLDGKKRTVVDIHNSTTPLAKWAAKKRKQRKKQAKKSRRANRK